MKFKRLVSLLILASMMLSLVPVFAQEGSGVLPVIEAVMPAIPAGFGAISPDDLAIELAEDPPFLVDVRQPEEWVDLGYIEGAVNVPVREIAASLDLLPADLDAPIVAYCKAGTRGVIAMTSLWVLGYTNVRNVAGGIDGWIAAGYDVTDADAEFMSGEAAAIDAELVAAVDAYLTDVLPQGWGQIGADDLALELLEDNAPFLLDVREVAEVEADGYLEGALNVPLREVAANLDQIPADQPIVVYCKGGWRGTIAMVALQMLGYDVRNLAGGFLGWVAAEYQIEGGALTMEETFSMEAVIQAVMPAIPAGFGAISPDDLAIELAEDPPFLVDVRQPEEWVDLGYIEGAVNVPVREIAASLDLLPADLDAPIVAYCKAGTRGVIAMTSLWVLGYTNVRSLAGGIDGWIAAGYDVTDADVEFMAEGPADINPELAAAVDAYLTDVLPQGWGQVGADDLALELLEDDAPFLLDVREVSEWVDDGYIEGAVNAPLREVADNLDVLPTDQPIVVYCKGGWRGTIAMVALQMLGYDVRNLAGGISGWVAAEYQVVVD